MKDVSGTLKGRVSFPETSWELLSLVSSKAPGAASKAAADRFTSRYYEPVRAYISAIARNRDDQEDLTHRFFLSSVLSGRVFTGADRARGSCRVYLKQAIRNFLVDEQRRRSRVSAGGNAIHIHPDADDRGWAFIPDHTEEPGAMFDRAWARGLVRQAIQATARVCEEKDLQDHFQLFAGRFLSEADRLPGWRELGNRFGVDEKTARTRAETAARHFRAELRRLVVAELTTQGDADEEIRVLIALF
jgi:DNA-directed RNA polymerase specialized sigma24 family protein